MNDRDCENCIHKVNGACKVWKCEFEPKRGMTKEEAIEIIECGEISNRWGKDGEEVEKMAIEALKQKHSISEDGTLTVNIEDGSKVSRVLVCGDNHFGGLYYPEQEPKTGHWIGDGNYICSCCKRDPLDFLEPCGLDGGSYMDTPMKYCPNCGAKMQEVKDNG